MKFSEYKETAKLSLFISVFMYSLNVVLLGRAVAL
jgi:hypothetical protein